MKAGQIIYLIKEEIKLIEADERYNYPCATIKENAPLALIQYNLEGKVQVLNKLLFKITGKIYTTKKKILVKKS
jgi:hypothetical protein